MSSLWVACTALQTNDSEVQSGKLSALGWSQSLWFVSLMSSTIFLVNSCQKKQGKGSVPIGKLEMSLKSILLLASVIF